MLRLALIENLQRSNLSAIEEAEAIRRLMEECGLTQTEVAKELGKSQGFVASRLALLKLPEAIQTKIMQRKISASHGELLSRISDEEILQQLANEVEKGMSVSKLKRCIQRVSPPSSQSSEAKTEAERVSFDAEAEPLEEIRSASGDDKELVGQTSGEMKDKEKRLEETDELIMVSEESIEVSSEGESRIEDAEQFAARHTSFSDLNFIKERENGSEKHLVRNIQKIIGTIESLAIALDEVCTNVSPSLRNCRALYVAAKDLFSKAQVLLSKVKKNCERMADCVLDEAIQDQKVVVDQIDLEFASDAKRAEYQRPLTEDSVGESIRSN
jgi:ParB-like chromosome segregation protein Spo0J